MFPANFKLPEDESALVNVQITKNMENNLRPVNPNDNEITETNDPPTVMNPAPGFFQRFLALIEDYLILGIPAYILGEIFSSVLYKMQGWEVYIGFFTALFYFAYFNSEKGGGQTPGKKQFKIKVVDANNNFISLKTSLYRSLLLQLAIFITGPGLMIPEFNSMIPAIPVIFIGILAVILNFGMYYFYLFNKPTRQVPHDMFCKTYVVKVESTEKIQPSQPGKVQMVFFWIFSCLLAAVFGGIFSQSFVNGEFNFDKRVKQKSELEIQRFIQENYKAANVSVSLSEKEDKEESDYTCYITYDTDKFPRDAEKFVEELAVKIRNNFPDAANCRSFYIRMDRSINLGVSSDIQIRRFKYKLSEKADNTLGNIEKSSFTQYSIGLFRYRGNRNK